MSKLYVVSTPIGNLQDITLRALEVLKNVDLILSEDTRETAKILSKWDIKTTQISYRDQNHKKVISHIKDLLKSGKNLCLVSDSGTPLISDPGFKLVQELKKNRVPIISIPGPSAVIAALSVSGLPTDNFSFIGFLPKKLNQRKSILQEFGKLPTTIVIYESPYRVRELLNEIYQELGNRTVCLAKDLTKMYEEVRTAPLENFIKNPEETKEKGEYVVLVAKENYSLDKK